MNNIKTKIEISKKFFCFYTFLNIGGYKPERTKINFLRKRVIKFLEKKITLVDKNIIEKVIQREEIKKEYWFPYRTWILCHGEPPKFEEENIYWRNKIDNSIAKEFEIEIKKFWIKYKINSLWLSVKKDYVNVEKRCLLNTKKAIKISLDYFHFTKKDVSLNEFFVIPNFLDEYNRAVGPKINQTAYAILGPSKNGFPFPTQRIQHEFLHSIINPLTFEVYNNIDSKKLSIIREGLIHGIVLRTNKENENYYENKLKKLKMKDYNIDNVIIFLKKFEKFKKDFKHFLIENKTGVL